MRKRIVEKFIESMTDEWYEAQTFRHDISTRGMHQHQLRDAREFFQRALSRHAVQQGFISEDSDLLKHPKPVYHPC